MSEVQRHRLPQNPRRAIEATLQLLDEALCTIEQWAEGRERHSVLYCESNRLTAPQREALMHEVAAIRDELRAARDTLGLAPRALSAAKDIWALCSGLRVDLMEVESKRLRGYGRFSQEAAAYIDAASGRLQQGLDRIVEILTSGDNP